MKSIHRIYLRLLLTLFLGTAFLGLLRWPSAAQLLPPSAAATIGDFDEDGVPDLLTATRDAAGSKLELRRGNGAALLAQTSFLAPVTIATNAPADFLGAGDFDADGHLDLVAATRAGDSLAWWRGDGRGGLAKQPDIALNARVTALHVGEVNRADGLADVVVGVTATDGARLLVYESAHGALQQTPERITLPAAAATIVAGRLAGDNAIDLVVATGPQFVLVQGRDRALSLDAATQSHVAPPHLTTQTVATGIQTLALSQFDNAPQPALAVLLADGTLQTWRATTIQAEATAAFTLNKEAKLQLATITGAPQLLSARVSSLPHDQLLLADGSGHLRIVNDEPGGKLALAPFASANGAPVELADTTTAIVPMRLNRDALSDLVLVQSNGQINVVTTEAAMTFTVTNTNDSGAGSLRQAMLDANANSGANTINFNLPGAAPFTITLQSDLPILTEAVTIDGTTQPGFAGRPIVELNGNDVQTRAGLTLSGGNSVVRGLVLNRFHTAAISINGGSNNRIEGNFIGTDVTGTVRRPNGGAGVNVFQSPNNIIGGTTAAAMNLLSGNNGAGIEFLGPNADANTVQGNLIGVNINGNAALFNNGFGVGTYGNNNNTIGGTTAGARNVIAGNARDGIGLSGTGYLVQGNYIGTDSNGTVAIPNSEVGIDIIGTPGGTIGGTTSVARNIICGHPGAGIKLQSGNASALLIQGNFIGVGADGTTALPNSTAVANSSGGIFAGGAGVTIGGPANGAGNVIANNGTAGVVVLTNGVQIRGNSIFANQGLGIDLLPIGAAANDNCDADIGVNKLQNYPGITAALSSGNQTIVRGTLNSAANTAYTLEFFSNLACDASGYGEGQTRLGSVQVTTDANCNASFDLAFPLAVPNGQVITATATDPEGNTSEFSRCVQVNVNADLGVTLTTSPNQASAGDNLIYTITVKNNGPDAATEITVADNLPADLTITSCTSPAGTTCTSLTNNRTVTLSSLAPGASATVTFFTRVNCNVASGATIRNTVTVASSAPDLTPANNTATADVAVMAATATLTTTSQAFPAAGGFGTINVASASNCGWTASSNNDFLVLTDTSSRLGNSTVHFFVAGNTTGVARTGTLTIAGQTFTVTQAAGSITPLPTPTPNAFGPCPTPSFRATRNYGTSLRIAGVATGDFNGDSFPDFAVTNQQTPGLINLLLNDGMGGFKTGDSYPVGTTPIAVTTADFNRDGKLDLAVANRDSANVSVLLGKGDGTFNAATNFVTGNGPQFVTAADFNRDGKPDLAVANSAAGTVTILPGDGSGGFGSGLTLTPSASPRVLVNGDFNNDNKPDLAVGAGTIVAVFLGDGAGGFAAPVSSPTDILQTGYAMADFNGDGKLDLATTGVVRDVVNVMIGDGAGRFGTPTQFNVFAVNGNATTTLRPVLVNAADFNNDGRADLLTANQNGTVSLLLGSGTGEFRSASFGATNLPAHAVTGRTPVSLVVEDFDGDGNPDAATGSSVEGAVTMLFGDGAGRVDTTIVPNLNGGVATADFNRDGKFDLLSGGNATRGFAASFGDGRGNFASVQSGIGIPFDRSVIGASTADFNGDGHQDFVLASGPDGGSGPSLLFGDAAGRFTASSLSLSTYAVAAGDLNGDGKPDLALADRETSTISIRLNDGTGQFAAPLITNNVNRPWSIALADFNSDGKLDVTVPNQDNQTVSVFPNDGAGKLGAAVVYPVMSEPVYVVAADFNGDNKPDLAVANLSFGVSVLLNDGTGKFGAAATVFAGGNPRALATGDFNGDGNVDLALTNQTANGVTVLLGAGTGSFIQATTFYTGSSPVSLAVQDFNGDGKPDLAVSHNFATNPVNAQGSVALLLNSCFTMGNLTSTIAANYRVGRIATDSIATAFGINLTTATMNAPSLPLPTTLAGVTVKVKDSQGDERLAPLFYVSPTQINYQIPAGTATGTATITVVNSGNVTATGITQISPLAPGLFTFDMTGQGIVAANVVRVKSDGSQQREPVATYDAAQQKYLPVPIDFGAATDQIFLELYGTGIRGRRALTAVSARIGSTEIEVQYAGAQGVLAGLDQINVLLPRTLAGSGEVTLLVTIDGQTANPVKLVLK